MNSEKQIPLRSSTKGGRSCDEQKQGSASPEYLETAGLEHSEYTKIKDKFASSLKKRRNQVSPAAEFYAREIDVGITHLERLDQFMETEKTDGSIFSRIVNARARTRKDIDTAIHELNMTPRIRSKEKTEQKGFREKIMATIARGINYARA